MQKTVEAQGVLRILFRRNWAYFRFSQKHTVPCIDVNIDVYIDVDVDVDMGGDLGVATSISTSTSRWTPRSKLIGNGNENLQPVLDFDKNIGEFDITQTEHPG